MGEADRILPRLEREQIRFEIETDASAHSARNLSIASRVMLFIHEDDLARWNKIRDEFFPV